MLKNKGGAIRGVAGDNLLLQLADAAKKDRDDLVSLWEKFWQDYGSVLE